MNVLPSFKHQGKILCALQCHPIPDWGGGGGGSGRDWVDISHIREMFSYH